MASISTYNTERLGVSAIEHQFQRMGWVFREREHTDMGIDADVEQKVGNTLTSQHIALQIKSGQSYLKENKTEKYISTSILGITNIGFNLIGLFLFFSMMIFWIGLFGNRFALHI